MARFFLLLLSFAPQDADALAKPGSASVQEWRTHYRVTADADVLYELTEITRVTDATDETIVLVRDDGHGDFLLYRRWSFKDQIVTHGISDVKNRSFAQASYKTPYSSRTRLEALKEGREHPQLFDVPTTITLETNGGKWDGIAIDWKENKPLRQLRRDLRQAMPFWLLEAVERMRGSYSSIPVAGLFYQLVGRFVVYDSRNDDAGNDAGSEKVKAVPAPANCEFDSALGYPCTSKQRERIAKAAKEGRTVSTY